MQEALPVIPAKTLLSGYAAHNSWFGMHYNMNIYRGCCHGCIYCDSRSECYGVTQFDTVRAKENALAILERELRAKRKTGVVGTGSMSDPYNPREREAELTRGALKLMDRYGFGIGIATKSDLVARDIDILRQIRSHSPALVKITLTTADDALAAKLEPYAPRPSQRLAAIRKLRQADIPVCVLVMPVLPYLENDPEQVTALLESVGQSGASYVYAMYGVTLRDIQRQYFFDRLDAQFPGVKQQYVHQYGTDYECRCTNDTQLYRITETVCQKWGMLYRMQDIIEDYQRPYRAEQTTLFDG